MMRNLLQPSLLSSNRSLSVSGFGFGELRKRRSINSNNTHSNRAVEERDSEFEIDPEKARESLRKLDEQLEFMSQKRPNPVPKIPASSLDTVRDEAAEDLSYYTRSFLPYLVSALVIFTIVYNILFIKVIKPSIDGPEAELAPVRSSIMREILEVN